MSSTFSSPLSPPLGEVSASFTSTHLGIRTTNRAAALADKVVRYAAIQEKGYVRLKTNLGEINLELHCNWVPLACENFLKHCRAGYYNKTLFHRSIKHFMVQVRRLGGCGLSRCQHLSCLSGW